PFRAASVTSQLGVVGHHGVAHRLLALPPLLALPGRVTGQLPQLCNVDVPIQHRFPHTWHSSDTTGQVIATLYQFGSFEETPLTRARRQFDVNVFGLAALTQRLLPPMRQARRGRIVNVSSLAGEFSSPMGGWYHASKFALEALSDSMRAELRPFGIQVTVVQPGPVRTPWHEDALASLQESSGHGAYTQMAEAVAAYHRTNQDKVITSDVDQVAVSIVKAATTAHPRPRYRVGRGAAAAVAISKLPDRTFDAMIRRQFRLP
ncbi:MAG: SDR family NAD(P)-dependent oxidoreductase, partial [Hyphomicrobiales bacterium]